MDRRSFLRLGGAVAGSAYALPSMGHSEVLRTPRTYVLVHGAWTGGWVWNRVAPLLRSSGDSVFVPTCTGVGERAHLINSDVGLDTWIQDVTSLLEVEDLRDVVLVGSGFSGVVISGVADRVRDRIGTLVYFDALIIPNGSSAFQQFPADIQERRRREISASGNDAILPAPSVQSFGLASPSDIEWVRKRLRPQPLRTYTDSLQLQNPVGNGLKRVYVDCTQPSFTPLVEVKKRLKQQDGWIWKELVGSHDEMVADPNKVASLLRVV